jgi:hypothetical protein
MSACIAATLTASPSELRVLDTELGRDRVHFGLSLREGHAVLEARHDGEVVASPFRRVERAFVHEPPHRDVRVGIGEVTGHHAQDGPRLPVEHEPLGEYLRVGSEAGPPERVTDEENSRIARGVGFGEEPAEDSANSEYGKHEVSRPPTDRAGSLPRSASRHGW